MSEDNQQVEVKRGNRGNLGKGTPSSRLKSLWHENKCPGSLKQFVRSLSDNPDVAVWRASKSGKNNQKRTDVNVRKARESSQSTRLTRRKKSDKG